MADAFAEGFEQLPQMYPDRDDYRYLVSTGRLVRAAIVAGQLVPVEDLKLPDWQRISDLVVAYSGRPSAAYR